MILGVWSQIGGFIVRFVESICLVVDNIIYSFIEQVYELFILISEAGVFSQNTIQEFAGRIYIFLGLIMLFVVSISLVQYILDPKKFSDSKIGGAKLVKDFAFVLIAIIAIPYIFEAAFRLQRIVLKDNIIGSLILGMKYTGEETDEKDNPSYYATYGGKIMAYSAASAFVTLSPDVASYACINQPVNDAGELSDSCSNLKGLKYDGGYDKDGVIITYLDQYIETYNYNKDFRYLLNKNFVTYEVEKDGIIYNAVDYSFIMSTIAGGFIIYILLGFCIDIAVRSVKLSFLQLIAPIPLMMKIIPGSGQKKFDSWVKQCVSTYCEIFIKLAAIYFAIFIIAAISTDGIQNVGGSGFVQTTLVRVAIIFGALMFAAELPKLLKDILGGSGNFKFGGPIKKIMSSPYSGALAGAAVGGGLATGANLYKGIKNAKSKWNDPETGKLKKAGLVVGTLTSGIGGGFSGMLRGGKNGSTGKSTLYKAGTDATADASLARNKRDAGFGLKETFGSEFSRIVGEPNTVGTNGKQAEQIEIYKDEYDVAANMQKRMGESYSDSAKNFMLKQGISLAELKSFTQRDRDNKTGIYSEDITEASKKNREEFVKRFDTKPYEAKIQSATDNMKLNKAAYEQYEKDVSSGKIKASEEKVAEFQKIQAQYEEEIQVSQEKCNSLNSEKAEFDELMKIEELYNKQRNETTTIQKKLNKAEANAKKYNGSK